MDIQRPGSAPERLVPLRAPLPQRPADDVPDAERPAGYWQELAAEEADNQDAYAGTFYAQLGGKETFRRLSERFYAEVAADEEFRAIYPEQDLGPAAVRLQLFLEQYWGGPSTYSNHRGHPRLRMRHAPYPVTPHFRDRWLAHMRTAVDSLGLPPLQRETLWDYLERAAHSLQNRP